MDIFNPFVTIVTFPLIGANKGTSMENKEIEIKKVGPIVETVWGVLLLVSSFALIFIGG